MSSKIEFHVDMHCNKCVDKIKEKLGPEDKIKKLDIDLGQGTVTVETTLPTGKVIQLIESTGKKALVKGFGDYKAAVAIVDVGNEKVKGVVRFMQVAKDACVVDGTVDGLNPGSYQLHIHECGDISNGCNSVGDIYVPETKDTLSDIGIIKPDNTGRSMFRIIQQPMMLSNLIGRSVVVKEPTGSRVVCGIIARSAGLFQNPKQICACDGISLWDERNKAKSTL